MFASYVKQMEEHLREQGLAGHGLHLLVRRAGPEGLRLRRPGHGAAEAVRPRLAADADRRARRRRLAGPVDIWCPVSSNYDHAAAEKRRAAGERFWWYVCCGPKAPYCTLFIDHPATELRVWHWQTWQRKIVGTLVWETNYWTSSAAFPDQPQNPTRTRWATSAAIDARAASKRYWGNGDGRFLYPPLAAAVPGKSGGEPVIDAAGLQHPLGDAPRGHRGLRVSVPAAAGD